jgi:hypothetical protein
VGNELLTTDDKMLFSRPLAALTQDAKVAKGKGRHGDAERLFLAYSVPSTVKASVGASCLLAPQRAWIRGWNKPQNVGDQL